MAFQLIPMPISILFAVVFVVAITFALWNLRRKGKIYRLMFKAVAVLGAVFLVVLVVSLIFQGPIEPGTVEVALTTDKSTYVLGEIVQIKVQVNNTNNWTVPGPKELIFRVYWDQIEGHGGFNFPNSYSTYAPHTVATYQIDNNSHFKYPGNYKIAVTLSGDFEYSPATEVNITINPA